MKGVRCGREMSGGLERREGRWKDRKEEDIGLHDWEEGGKMEQVLGDVRA